MVLVAIIAVPVSTLMLAKLFNSNTLGWMFGLMLMAGAALMPVVLLGWAVLALVRRIARGRVETPSTATFGTLPLTVLVERGSVHASDDAPSRQIAVPPGSTLRALIESAIANAYLPRISGGKATWIVESNGGGAGTGFAPVAVCAQQWATPVLLAPAGTTVAGHFGRVTPRLNLRYRCQDDPHTVLAEVSASK